MTTTLARVTWSTLLGVALLATAACGGDGDDAAPATPDATTSPTAALPDASATASPTPAPAPDERSPAALADLLVFEGPDQVDPVAADGLAAYEDFVRQFVVAEGLADAVYPPLTARVSAVDPTLADGLFSGLRPNAAAGRYVLGEQVETVLEVVGNASSVLVEACVDYRDRVVYEADGTEVGPFSFERGRYRTTLDLTVDGWIVTGSTVLTPEECP